MSENNLIYKLKKPYNFENQEYTEIDYSGLENFTAEDLIEIESTYTKSGFLDAVKEISLAYACIVGQKASKKPLEFFYGLPYKDAIAFKNEISNHFFD